MGDRSPTIARIILQICERFPLFARDDGALEHRKRAIDSREHFLFPENFEEMI